MHTVLRHNQFFVKEQVGMFKAANSFDIFDPSSNQKIIECREPNLGLLTKLLRFTDYKRMTPFHVELTTPNGDRVLSIKRGISLLRSTVEVRDERAQLVGTFKQKLFSIGGKFDVLDAQDNVVCQLRGKWTSWDFRFVQGDRELAAVSKKWAGLGKELFTSADNYMLTVQNTVPADSPHRILIMAAVMCIDMVLKE
ncbi:MAG: phospholipid scramblase-related protein [Pseudomonadota bacterium]